MSGFGSGVATADGYEVRVDAQAVNGRFLKVQLKAPAAVASWESDVEARVKRVLGRGTVRVTLSIKAPQGEAVAHIDEAAVRTYQGLFRKLGLDEGAIPTLPGVVVGRDVAEGLPAVVKGAVERGLDKALNKLLEMRSREGQLLSEALETLCGNIEALAKRVANRGPGVVDEYRLKLKERIAALMRDMDTDLDPQAIEREVVLFADRCDVTEELERLAAHLTHIRQLLQSEENVGRSLEFLGQELLREANTIGSKSADAQLASLVVQLKSEIEKFREQIANVE